MNDNEYIQELREGEEAETVNLAGFQVVCAYARTRHNSLGYKD